MNTIIKRGGCVMIHLDYKSSKPIYEQMIEQMKYNVMKGYLSPMDAIPSVRKLALDLKITPGTVANAYQELERQGVIETIRGKGTFIAEEIDIKQDDAKIQSIRKKLSTEILELKMMGFDKKQTVELVKNVYDEI
jgi:GntR family transcriptional regulator